MTDRKHPLPSSSDREQRTIGDGSRYCFSLFDEMPEEKTKLDQKLDDKKQKMAATKTTDKASAR